MSERQPLTMTEHYLAERAALKQENARLRERLRRVLDGDDIDAENARLRHRVQLARSTVELLRSYVNALHAGRIDHDLLAMMRGETDRAITTWRALTEPDALDAERPGDVGEPTE